MSEELTIDTEFSELGWPLSDEERSSLRENLLKYGCREPILVWANHDNTILDGHNRYSICTAEEITYKVKAIKLETRQDCIDFICDLQLSRRNSTEEHKSYLRAKKHEGYLRGKQHDAAEFKALTDPPKGSGHECPTPMGGAKTKSITKQVAEETGVSERTIRRDVVFAHAVDELAKPIKDAVIRKELKVSHGDVQALAELPKTEQKEIVAQVNRGEAKNVKAALKSKAELALGQKGFRDEQGNLIPKHLLEFRSMEWKQEMLDAIKKLVQVLRKQTIGTGGTWVNLENALEGFEQARNAVLHSIFYSLCKDCGGKVNGCKSCRKSGWMPKWRFDGDSFE